MWPKRASGGVLVYCSMPLPLKGSEFDWLYDPNIRCQLCLHMLSSVLTFCVWSFGSWSELKWFIHCLKECWSVWERARHAGISAVCGQHVHTCEVPLNRWVSRGAVEVRGHLYSCGSANRRPAGFSPALSMSNATQEDCVNVCTPIGSRVVVFDLQIVFFGSKLFMMSFISFLHTLYCFKAAPSWRRCDEESLENALVTFANMVTKVINMSISSLLKISNVFLWWTNWSLSCYSHNLPLPWAADHSVRWTHQTIQSDSSKHR